MVKPQYFMFWIDWILGGLNFLGYCCASLCLTGMLLTYISINRIKEALLAESITERENREAEGVKRELLDDAGKAKLDLEKAGKKEALRLEKVEKYNDLSQRFNLYFTILALILTLGTLSTSSLFSGLNSLPYIAAINKSQGYSQFPQEYVYLYGIIHSAILFSVFSLLRSQLEELKSKLGITGTDDIYKTTFSKKAIEMIITGGPLIAPGLKAIFDYF
jgi:hypothetical protein